LIGAQAELARLYALQNRWREAAVMYKALQASGRFYEIHAGLQTVINGLQAEGDRHLKEGRTSEALEQFTHALTVVQEPPADDKQKQAELCSRLGLTYLGLADPAEARSHFLLALQNYRAKGAESPGERLAPCAGDSAPRSGRSVSRTLILSILSRRGLRTDRVNYIRDLHSCGHTPCVGGG
jgi:hypothetical protein